METHNGFFVYSLFTLFYSFCVFANMNHKIKAEASSCKNKALQDMCTAKCGNQHICLSGKCFCLQPSLFKRNVQDATQSTEPQVINSHPYNEQLSREKFDNKPQLRHHIAHFCPDLEEARQCIRNCMNQGKPAFCGKDHVCYCGHKYDAPVDDEKLNLPSMYAEFKDLYDKYFGNQR